MRQIRMVDGNSQIHDPSKVKIEVRQELIDVTDPFGVFGPPDTYEKFMPGIKTCYVDGVPVPGPITWQEIA